MLVLFWLLVALAVLVGACVAITAIVKARIEAALPPLGQTIAIAGATIRYVDEGAGPPLLLLHGLGGQLRHWTFALVDRLKKDYRVIAFDRPGCGYSTMPPGGSPHLLEQAAVVAGLIRALGLERPLVVGHSLGGALALAVALEHREAICGAALVAPLSHPMEVPPKPFRLMATVSPLRRFLLGWIVATPGSLVVGKATVADVFGPDPVPPHFDTKGGGLLLVRPEAFIHTSDEMTSVALDMAGMAERYAGLDCPVAILYGTRDQILDPEQHGGTLARKVPGATIEYIEGAGHMLPQVRIDETAAFIRRMAVRVWPQSSAAAGSRK